MSVAERLYTPELLALTLRLAQYPWADDLPLKGDARSKSCGSTLAVGQAAGTIFADAAIDMDRAAIAETLASLQNWLAGEGNLPDWPGLGAIEAARAFPGRHGAMMLPWQAALAALSSEPGSV